MNQLTLVGFIGSDLTSKNFDNDKKLATFPLCCKSRQKEKDIWYRVSLWNGNFEGIYPYLKKGAQVIVVGELQKPRHYVDKEGKSVAQLEVVPYSINLLKSAPDQASALPKTNNEPVGKHFAPSVFDEVDKLF